MSLRIRYRGGDGELSERTISAIVVEPPNSVHAFCHLRKEERTFVLDRIEQAVNTMTGEIISDIWLHFGLSSRKPPEAKLPKFSEQAIQISPEESMYRRKADKNALFRRFKYAVIATAKKRQLWELFGSRCFCCGAIARLELDHHIPQKLGGRLVPGNVVLLCGTCNSAKRTIHPSVFYTATQLVALEPILHAELRLFDFTFSWSRWAHNPKEYLLSLGVTEEEAHMALTNRDHPLYVGYDPLA